MKVSIIGASGYTGGELLRILYKHKEVEIDKVISNTYKDQKVSDLFPNFKNVLDIKFIGTENLKEDIKDSEAVFLAVPHKAAMQYVPDLIADGKKVIDLSADFRLDDKEVYEKWYEVEHTAENLFTKAVYGLPEINRTYIKKGNLIANPGCYPTTAILGLSPIVKEGSVKLDSIIIDSKSGVSGAGKKCNKTTHYSETNENFKAYGIASHRHTPEIEQELEKIAGKKVNITFTPHLVPMTRGMLSTIYVDLTKNISQKEIFKLYDDFYKNEKFIRIKKDLVETKHVRGSNFVDIGIKKDIRNNRLIITSAIDNLLKGASSQAVQNFNIMCGFNENEGIDLIGYLP
ncbi:MAG: N-acetyl-gamma-glutamyl-phosphate reductase [Fusobacteriota bacterium]